MANLKNTGSSFCSDLILTKRKKIEVDPFCQGGCIKKMKIIYFLETIDKQFHQHNLIS